MQSFVLFLSAISMLILEEIEFFLFQKKKEEIEFLEFTSFSALDSNS